MFKTILATAAAVAIAGASATSTAQDLGFGVGRANDRKSVIFDRDVQLAVGVQRRCMQLFDAKFFFP